MVQVWMWSHVDLLQGAFVLVVWGVGGWVSEWVVGWVLHSNGVC